MERPSGCLGWIKRLLVLVVLLALVATLFSSISITVHVSPPRARGLKWWPPLKPSDPRSPPARTTEVAGIPFVVVPAGRCRLGCAPGEPGFEAAEGERQVEFGKPFAISVYEITNAQYWPVMEPTRVVPDGDLNLPVTDVTAGQAEDFCAALSDMFDHPFRLPTEDEWEYACRAGTTDMYAVWEGDLAEACQRWLDNDRYLLRRRARSVFNFDNPAGLVPVGSFPPNAFGLHDMHGNAAEWCAFSQAAPSLQMRPARGGSWASSSPLDCRSAKRSWQLADNATPAIGFRLVQEPN